jgi:hypothetical protein
MHTQASYLDPNDVDGFVESFVARNEQVKQASDFIAKTMATEYANGDLVMFVGDFNINAAPSCEAELIIKKAFHDENAKRKDGTVKKTPYSEDAEKLINDEYTNGLVAGLQNEAWTLKDCLRDSPLGGNGTMSPVTYGGCETDA